MKASSLLPLSLAFGALALAAPAACTSDAASPASSSVTCGPVAYPPGPYGARRGDVLEPMTFDGVSAVGARGEVALSDGFAACGGQSVLVVRVGASFCGTCRAQAENATRALSEGLERRVRLVDVLVRDEDGDPPALDAAERWQSIEDVKGAVAIDPTMRLVADGRRLPRVLVVDPRTMRVREDLDDPAPEKIADAVATVAAEIDGRAPPPPREVAKIDGRFDAFRWAMILRMPQGGSPPRDPTNRVADDDVAAAFGKELFADTLLSPSGRVSCERCHERHRAFTDGSETATGGVGGATRNTPSVVFAGWSRWQLWDGRADTLWMQALLPLEDKTEFASSRLFVAHRVYDAWRERYEKIFGPMPPLGDRARFPAEGKPGDAVWDAMAASDRDAVTRVFVDVGKAIAAFERGLRIVDNPLDQYARKQLDALSPKARDGLVAFFEAGCAQCHWGGRLTDDAFHVVRFPTGRGDLVADRGRIDGVSKLEASEFRADGNWSDAALARKKVVPEERLLGAFKTPALRGVSRTPPFGHGGSVPSLKMAVELHRTRGMPSGSRLTTGEVEPWLVPFDAERVDAIVAFLESIALEFN